MNKLKCFIENMLVYGFGGIISKVIPLIMLPVITRMLPSIDYYGVSDMSYTIVQFGSAIAIMGMYDAMYRMFFENDGQEYKRKVCSTAFGFTLVTSCIMFFLMLIYRKAIASFFFKSEKFVYIVLISAIATLVGATNTIVSAPTRMQNKRKVFLIINTISPLLSYSLAIILIMKGHYVIALPFAVMISEIVVETAFGILNHDWFDFRSIDKKILKQLLTIAIPLLPNFLVYWLFNSCDKVMITNIIGVGATGIYSVGSKFGHVSQLIYIAFAGGWQFFAFSTMKEKDQVRSNSLIFEYLGIISLISTTFVCAWSHSLFKLIFPKEYISGYIVAPYLFLAPLLQMLFQVIANQFLVIKKTWPNIVILFSGAIANLIFNFLLIPALNIEGAAIATLLGYGVSNILCVIVLKKMKLLFISCKFVICFVIMIFYMVIWRLIFSDNILAGTVTAIILSCFFSFEYKTEISILCRRLLRK